MIQLLNDVSMYNPSHWANYKIERKVTPYELSSTLFPIPLWVLERLSIKDMDKGTIEHVKAQEYIISNFPNFTAEDRLKQYVDYEDLEFLLSGSVDLNFENANIYSGFVCELKFGKAEPILRYSYLIQLIAYMYMFQKDGVLIYTNTETQVSKMWYFEYNQTMVEFAMKKALTFFLARPLYLDEEWYYKVKELEKILALWVDTEISDIYTPFEDIWTMYAKSNKWEMFRE